MFRIGEFSKIAQVSGRLLRYYDQIDLLKPVHTDPQTGYRYYSAQQLPELNRILALKELGLSLDQITRLMHDNISTEEIRGMLVMKKAQVEMEIHEELARIRTIESRIQQIDTDGDMKDYGIVVKSLPAQKFLSVREICEGFQYGRQLLLELSQMIPARVGSKALGYMAAVVYSDTFEWTDIDLELGYLLHDSVDTEFRLSDGSLVNVSELPALEEVATITRLGDIEEAHIAYSSIGLWAEANGYELYTPSREVFIQPAFPGKEHEAVTEIQFPFRRVRGGETAPPKLN